MALALGVHIGQQNLAMADLRSLWRRFDDAGVDWISVWDHFYEAPPAGGTLDHFEAISTLGCLAADTRNARLGCLVFYVGYRNLGQLAKAATTIDHISGGRFEIGVGAGWHEPEARAFGYDFPPTGRRLDMLEEAVPVLRSLLTEPRTTHEGEWFRVENASCLPAPVQERLPIWVGGTGEKRTLKIAARHADGWNAAYVAPDRFAQLSGVLDAHCHTAGRDPATIKRAVNLIFALSTSGATAEAVLEQQGWGAMGPWLAPGALVGAPESAAEQIAGYVEAGADSVNIALRAPWDDKALDAYLEALPSIRASAT